MKQVNHNSREAVDFIHCLTLFVYIIPVVYHLVINKPLIIIIIIIIITQANDLSLVPFQSYMKNLGVSYTLNYSGYEKT